MDALKLLFPQAAGPVSMGRVHREAAPARDDFARLMEEGRAVAVVSSEMVGVGAGSAEGGPGTATGVSQEGEATSASSNPAPPLAEQPFGAGSERGSPDAVKNAKAPAGARANTAAEMTPSPVAAGSFAATPVSLSTEEEELAELDGTGRFALPSPSCAPSSPSSSSAEAVVHSLYALPPAFVGGVSDEAGVAVDLGERASSPSRGAEGALSADLDITSGPTRVPARLLMDAGSGPAAAGSPFATTNREDFADGAIPGGIDPASRDEPELKPVASHPPLTEATALKAEERRPPANRGGLILASDQLGPNGYAFGGISDQGSSAGSTSFRAPPLRLNAQTPEGLVSAHATLQVAVRAALAEGKVIPTAAEDAAQATTSKMLSGRLSSPDRAAASHRFGPASGDMALSPMAETLLGSAAPKDQSPTGPGQSLEAPSDDASMSLPPFGAGGAKLAEARVDDAPGRHAQWGSFDPASAGGASLRQVPRVPGYPPPAMTFEGASPEENSILERPHLTAVPGLPGGVESAGPLAGGDEQAMGAQGSAQRPLLAGDLPPVAAHQPVASREQAASIGRQIALAIREGEMGGVELHLRPEELGSLRILLRQEGDLMRVILQAERGETLELLRRTSSELEDALNMAGYGNTSLSYQRSEGEKAGAAPPTAQQDWGESELEQTPIPRRQSTAGLLDLRL